jgi:hypothetical protein
VATLLLLGPNIDPVTASTAVSAVVEAAGLLVAAGTLLWWLVAFHRQLRGLGAI